MQSTAAPFQASEGDAAPRLTQPISHRRRSPWRPVVELIAGWSARHRKTVLLSWLLLVVGSIMIGHEAITSGIASSAGVVTSAAVIMVSVFSIFATLSLIEFKMFGVGMASAILIDATLVRGVLLPAAMALLGHRNWYLPRWLTRLPGIWRGDRYPAAVTAGG